MDHAHAGQVLHIKKYPNRRYYDATRSQHVTLKDLFDLIVAGHTVHVVDSRTAADITNLVLAQILIDKDQPKLDLFPTWILHRVIRAGREDVSRIVDQLFGPRTGAEHNTPMRTDVCTEQAIDAALASQTDGTSEITPAVSNEPSAHTPPDDHPGASADPMPPPRSDPRTERQSQ